MQTDQEAEVRRLKKELDRVTEERDILKKATAYCCIPSVFCAKCSAFTRAFFMHGLKSR